jgi:hypothetical protein
MYYKMLSQFEDMTFLKLMQDMANDVDRDDVK